MAGRVEIEARNGDGIGHPFFGCGGIGKFERTGIFSLSREAPVRDLSGTGRSGSSRLYFSDSNVIRWPPRGVANIVIVAAICGNKHPGSIRACIQRRRVRGPG